LTEKPNIHFGPSWPEVGKQKGSDTFTIMPVQYQSEVKTVPFGNGTIQIENLTPVLSQKDREKRKREIETRLFDVFSKYEDKKPANAAKR